MRLTSRFTIAALLMTALACTAVADERIDVTRKVTADAVISIDNLSGSVIVKGWSRGEIRIEGTLGEGSERLAVEGDEDRLEIEVVIPRRARNVEASHLEIHLPEGCSVRVGTVSADIDVSGLTGEVSMHTVSGDILAVGSPRETNADTVSGDAILKVDSELVNVNSVSGDIVLEGMRGAVTVSTVSGDIGLRDAEPKRLSFSSVSADLDFDGAIRGDGRYRFESQSGNIKLVLGSEPDADFWVTSFSGDIDSDFGGKVRRTSKYAPGKELKFRTGSGDARVEIETFSGDVVIRKH